MKNKQDKTAEIEVRLKAIKICPDNTCLFFKKEIASVSESQKCLNCVFACFLTDKNHNLTEDGYCLFKTVQNQK